MRCMRRKDRIKRTFVGQARGILGSARVIDCVAHKYITEMLLKKLVHLETRDSCFY
jgi:hypothetical protein